MIRRRAFIFVFGLALAACGDEQPKPSLSATVSSRPMPPPAIPTGSPTTTTAATPSSSAGPSKPLSANGLDIPALNIALEPPAGLTGGKAQEAGRDVMITFTKQEIAIALGVAHGDLAHLKEKTAGEKGFTKWVVDEPEKAVAEIDTGKGKEYIGFSVKKVGDANIQCSTFTSSRPTSPNEKAVREALAICDGLRPR